MISPSREPQRSETGGRYSVLHVGKYFPPHMGGIETHLQSLCTGLQHHVDVEVLVSNIGRKTTNEIVEGVHLTRAGTLVNVAGAPFSPKVFSKIRSSEAEIIHIHLPNPFANISYLLSRHRKLVLSYHGDVVRQRALAAAFHPILTALLDRAEVILVATQNHIDSSPILSPYRSKCRIVPYGIDVSHFASVDESEVSRAREQWGPNRILSVGRLVYYKGFDYLIRAMKEIDGRLLIVGEGPLLEDLEKLVAQEGLRDRVRILGGVTDVRPYYQACDVFVLPSVAKSEGFGIVQLEAMASGKPVVNTALDSGVPHVSLHGVTGLTVAPGDTGALSKAVRTLLSDGNLRRNLGISGKKRVEQEFSRELMVERTLEAYRSFR